MSSRKRRALLLSTALVVAVSACSRDGRTLAPASPEQNESIAIAPTETTVSLEPSETFAVRGPWVDGGEIDPSFTCFGRNVSPPLEFTGQPAGTVTLAVLLHDVEAPDQILWLMANIAGGTVALAEATAPPEVVVATNSGGSAGYLPPCPASGERRQYLLTVFALDKVLETSAIAEADGSITADALLTAVEMSTFDLAESTFSLQAP